MDGRGWQAVEKLNPMPTGQLKCSEEMDITIPSGCSKGRCLSPTPRRAKSRLSPTKATLPYLVANKRRFTSYVSRM